MANISDIIEAFLIETMGGDAHIDLSRNDLATYFSCAPSQINYVLSTRFAPSRGFLVESQRGGGGFVRLIRLKTDKISYLTHLVHEVIGEEIGYNESMKLLENLVDNNQILQAEKEAMASAIAPRALNTPFKIENRLRANILKSFLINKQKRGGSDK